MPVSTAGRRQMPQARSGLPAPRQQNTTNIKTPTRTSSVWASNVSRRLQRRCVGLYRDRRTRSPTCSRPEHRQMLERRQLGLRFPSTRRCPRREPSLRYGDDVLPE
jgi:hypothetical protein